MVWRTDEQTNPPRRVLERRRFEEGNRRIPGSMERKPKTLRLDRHGGVDRRKALTLPANPGTDSAGVHASAQEKNEKVVVQLFMGHYTRV